MCIKKNDNNFDKYKKGVTSGSYSKILNLIYKKCLDWCMNGHIKPLYKWQPTKLVYQELMLFKGNNMFEMYIQTIC